jgi:hypothetical protein
MDTAPPHALPRRRKRPQSSLFSRTWWVVLVLAALAAGVVPLLLRSGDPSSGPLEGYITDIDALRQEYLRQHRKPLADLRIEQQFQQTTQLMLRRDLKGAAGILEEVARTAAIPAVFNDLGVLYAELHDRARAVHAFREALARDASYRPVRENLRRLKAFIADSADPVTHELEPNTSIRQANLIAVGTPADGEIDGKSADLDFFRFNAPPPPRDILAIELVPSSKTLAPALRLLDADGKYLETRSLPANAGESLVRTLSPAPNTTLYIEVSGARNSAGAYTLTVQAGRFFDLYEPNDDILSARPLVPGSAADANIMDGRDTDYFSVPALRNGTLTVQILNRSTTLMPALTTFGPDRRTTGFGPDVFTPGAGLRHTIQVVEGQTYFFQVWSQGDSSGEYSILVE